MDDGKLVECKECIHRWDCPAGKSYGNAACLTIQEEDPLFTRLKKVAEIEKSFKENPDLLMQKINEDITRRLMEG